jgi:hypothetical protein
MKNILFLLITMVVCVSCSNEKKQPENVTDEDIKTEIGKVYDFMKQYEDPSQTFKVPSNKRTQVKGKQGTVVFINPDDLVKENGKALGKGIEVELRELMDKEQLLRANAQTTSDGKLLVSGGAYYINITSEGEPLKIKDGKSLTVEFPKMTNKEMSLFYGQRDSVGQMNWTQAQQKFESKPEKFISEEGTDSLMPVEALLYYISNDSARPLTAEEKRRLKEDKKKDEVYDKVYKPIELNQLGWINCDRFYDFTDNKNLQIAINRKDSIVSSQLFLVFKNINSVVSSRYYNIGGRIMNAGFPNLPKGAKVQLLAISYKNGRIFTHKSNLIITKDETVNLTFKMTSPKEFERMLKSI